MLLISQWPSSTAMTHDSASSHAESTCSHHDHPHLKSKQQQIVDVLDPNTIFMYDVWWLRRDQEPAVKNVGSRCRGWRTVPCVGLSRILSSPTSCAMDRLSGLQIQMLTLSLESMEAGKAAFCKVHNTSSLFYHFPEYQDWYWVSWLTASTPRDTASCRTLSGEEQTKLKSR